MCTTVRVPAGQRAGPPRTFDSRFSAYEYTRPHLTRVVAAEQS